MPDDPVERFGFAGVYLGAGPAEDAVVEYEATVRPRPDYSAAYRGPGRALLPPAGQGERVGTGPVAMRIAPASIGTPIQGRATRQPILRRVAILPGER
jgi:hypothetical protein